MAVRQAMLKGVGGNLGLMFGSRGCISFMAQSPPLGGIIDVNSGVAQKRHVLPEFDWNQSHGSNVGSYCNKVIGFSLPSFSYGGSMELMAVPKRKVTPHKRGIRNGPKALKPIPVIIRCKVCGRVKLPHFFCCSGKRDDTAEQNGSTN
ncbi:hypothetical protein L6164_020831 [Bauhinia variegata]|uniref:Uncharacterized protein n=1 Tax=Bauhinia variegata TaxID=167791 RepID=A0ACB9MYC0_BAUVA|nr:hypothetical protein L6164_020831 [Bauhinia variegata]